MVAAIRAHQKSGESVHLKPLLAAADRGRAVVTNLLRQNHLKYLSFLTVDDDADKSKVWCKPSAL